MLVPATTSTPNDQRSRPGVTVQRRRVLEAAWRVLGRSGLEDIRVEDVLREAGVSRQTFYRCFANMDALFEAIHVEVEGFLRGGVAAALTAATAPDTWLDALIDAMVDAAVAAGPALVAIEREETRPGSPFYGARARRQADLAATIAAWYRERYAVRADVWRIRAALMAFNQLCLTVCDPAQTSAGDVAAAKAAAHAFAHGLLLWEGLEQGRWDLTPPHRHERKGATP